MAEKYGTIPKRFTKEWWEYFWDYYKIHTIVALFILVSIIITVYQLKTAPKYDFNITYAGNTTFGDESVSAIQEYLSEYLDDTDGNGKKALGFQQLIFTEDQKEMEYTAAMITKLNLEFVTDDTYLFIFNKEKAKYLFETSDMEDAFLPVSQWAENEVDEEKLYITGDTAYAVSLKDCELFNDPYIDPENLYIAVRKNFKSDDEVIKRAETAKKLANILIK